MVIAWPPLFHSLGYGGLVISNAFSEINVKNFWSMLHCDHPVNVSTVIFAVLIGALNDRLLLANTTDINPRQKKGVEIRSCLMGLLEPLLIGFATMQQIFEQKLDLSEILYQITSRFLPSS